jgi:hypothetical protein
LAFLTGSNVLDAEMRRPSPSNSPSYATMTRARFQFTMIVDFGALDIIAVASLASKIRQ